MSARGSPGLDVRCRAARALDRVLAARSPVDEPLAAAEAGLDRRDRRLLRELVLGSLRWLRRLDHVLEAASGHRIEKIRPRLLAPLRVGLYQLLFLDRVPVFAAVDRAVAEARRRAGRGGAGFANAVLRKVAARPELDAWPVTVTDPVARLGIETSYPDFLVRRWIDRFGRETARRLLDAGNRQRPLWLLAMAGRCSLIDELCGEGVETVPGELTGSSLRVVSGDPFSTPAYARGAFYAQDEASQAAAVVPPPRPGERVLDAAAAPGGKGFALAASEATVAITAADRSLARLVGLRANQRRLGRSDPLLVCDAAVPPFMAAFDRVVADLPCSGTGTLSRHAELKWRLSPDEIDRLAGEGSRLLEGLAEVVKPGGLLVAITCSIEREENEEVVAKLLERRPELEPVRLEEQLTAEQAEHVFAPGAWRIQPTAERDGFTVHALKRALP